MKTTKLPQFERVGQFWRFKSSVQCSQGQGGGGWAPFHAEHDTPAVIFHTCLPWREVTTGDRVAKSQWPNVEEWDTFREAIPYQKWSFFNMLKNCNWVGSNATSYCGKNIVQTDLGKQSFKRLFRFGWFFSSARLLKCNTFFQLCTRTGMGRTRSRESFLDDQPIPALLAPSKIHYSKTGKDKYRINLQSLEGV